MVETKLGEEYNHEPANRDDFETVKSLAFVEELVQPEVVFADHGPKHVEVFLAIGEVVEGRQLHVLGVTQGGDTQLLH